MHEILLLRQVIQVICFDKIPIGNEIHKHGLLRLLIQVELLKLEGFLILIDDQNDLLRYNAKPKSNMNE